MAPQETLGKPSHPPTDADMAAMGYSAYDIECIREWSPAFNSESELEAKHKGIRDGLDSILMEKSRQVDVGLHPVAGMTVVILALVAAGLAVGLAILAYTA